MRVSFRLPRFLAFVVFFTRRVKDAYYNARCDMDDQCN